jgi:hypothetical protein
LGDDTDWGLIVASADEDFGFVKMLGILINYCKLNAERPKTLPALEKGAWENFLPKLEKSICIM